MELAVQLDGKYGETLRGEFCVPTMRSMGLESDDLDQEVMYLCGNSLGLMPRKTRSAVTKELDAWSMRGVEAHFRHPGVAEDCTSWVDVDLPVLPLLEPIVGAQTGEVAVMNSLTANLNSLLVAFYRPEGKRAKILFEKAAFPSDYYAFYAQCELHGLDPTETLIQVEPRDGETSIKTQDVLDTIERYKDELALVCLPGIQYYSGQLFEMEAITKFAHQYPGIVVGWDLAHAVGNVELQLHDWGVDFACWCSYKYLNAGPGAIGGLFVHSKHAGSSEKYLPRLSGWWGNNAARRFQMLEKWEPIPGALGFRQSNPSVLDVVALRSSLELFAKYGGMSKIRARSLKLTGYLLKSLKQSPFYTDDHSKIGFNVITPVDRDSDHGSQLSLRFYPLDSDTMEQVSSYANKRGLIGDERRPNVMRLAPAPLYNTFQDVFGAVQLLNEALTAITKRKR